MDVSRGSGRWVRLCDVCEAVTGACVPDCRVRRLLIPATGSAAAMARPVATLWCAIIDDADLTD